MNGPTWIRYRTQVDLLEKAENDEQVQKARSDMLANTAINTLIKDVSSWENAVLKRHNDAVHPLHKLSFLAEIGMRASDPGIQNIIDQIYAHPSPEGLLNVLINIPTVFGGNGKDEWHWSLCDAPLLLYCLVKMGEGEDEQTKKAIDFLVGLCRPNGWPCAASPALGKFHGPGRREDPCPYATLLMLKLLGVLDGYENSMAVQKGTEVILHLWQASQTERPYLFRMGNDFRKLKAPLVWYDILHVVDVLSHFAQARQDKRFHEMMGIIHSKKNSDGLYTPESVWMKWKGWEFAQKREPSFWLTFLVARIEKRLA